jgi:FlaA1/EpsC-like NDP-sugar epimerase
MAEMTAPKSSQNSPSVDKLIALPRGAKRLLAVLSDAALCVLTVWLSICFRFESWVYLSGYQWVAVGVSVGLALPLLAIAGFYQTVIRFAGKQVISMVLRAMAIYTLLYAAIFTAYGLPLVPRTIGILQPLLLLVGLALLRLLAKHFLSDSVNTVYQSEQAPRVLIYGAGNSGQQLAASLQTSGASRVLGFIDDDVHLQKAQISGVPVYAPAQVAELVHSKKVSDVLLAIPSLSRTRRNEIIRLLSGSQLAVRTLPSLSNLAQGKVSESDLRELDLEDLLGRDPVAARPDLLTRKITDKTVLVTGAGGSIGSELCRQIIQLAPSSLVLLEQSEYALYALNEELAQSGYTGQLICVLANVQDAQRMHAVMAEHKPHTIYHAAAYKHVPLVESNPVAGVQNNVLGTLRVAQAALAAGVQDMVLISTDKAVRPTNVMGASKRLAELCLQALADLHKADAQSTRFSMVRFGNVLGSSGSVVPKFREQIKAGGPITITHPEITRFFMTIPEAAQLVLQAAALTHTHSQGAAVFLLDMGEPVKIFDLAKIIVQLSGQTAQFGDQAGDIAIEFTGLRPGEKLYEELLVSAKSEATEHRKIFAAFEEFHSWQELQPLVELLSGQPSAAQVLPFLHHYRIGYQPQANPSPQAAA